MINDQSGHFPTHTIGKFFQQAHGKTVMNQVPKPSLFEQWIKPLAVVIFGLCIPLAILVMTYVSVNNLLPEVKYDTTSTQLITHFSEAKKHLLNANDFRLFSQMYSEHANQKTMVNKQVMKVAVVQLGFAVISIGMMLIILGINDGGAQVTGEATGFKFDIKTASTGVVVFLVGALMATLGGVMKNEYSTVPNPSFDEQHVNHKLELEAFQDCRSSFKNDVDFKACFAQMYFELNKGEVK